MLNPVVKKHHNPVNQQNVSVWAIHLTHPQVMIKVQAQQLQLPHTKVQIALSNQR
jgi:hypothetical protein